MNIVTHLNRHEVSIIDLTERVNNISTFPPSRVIGELVLIRTRSSPDNKILIINHVHYYVLTTNKIF